MSVDKPWAPATRCGFEYPSLARSGEGGASEAAPSTEGHPPRAPVRAARRPGKLAATPADLVSVCVTVFNYESYLEGCLDSVKAQTHQALELIVVDDCSDRDESMQVAIAWAKRNRTRFQRVAVHSHCENQGPAEARNTAFRLARGEHVFIIDADNEIYPRAIAALHEAALLGGFDATYSQIERFGAERCIGSADIWDEAEMLQNNYVDVMSLLRRDAWEKVGGFSHIDEGWEDYDFWLKFIDAGLKAAYLPEILCRYRVHDKSRTATEAHRAHDDLKALMAFRHSGYGMRAAEPDVGGADRELSGSVPADDRPAPAIPPAVPAAAPEPEREAPSADVRAAAPAPAPAAAEQAFRPLSVRSWTAQRSSYQIDAISGIAIGDLGTRQFPPAAELRLDSHTSGMDTTPATNTYLVCINKSSGTVFFVGAERVPGADTASGISVQASVKLRNWGDGLYRLGFVEVAGGRAAFQLTPLSIRVLAGLFVEAGLADVGDADVATAFALVAARALRSDRPISSSPSRERVAVLPPGPREPGRSHQELDQG